MRDQILLPETGLYKANLHCHTTVSDGRLTPVEIKELYMSEGYSIVAYTDHREYAWHKDQDDANFMALPSMEADLTEKGDYWPTERTFHFNRYDTRRTLPDGIIIRKFLFCCPSVLFHNLSL